MAETITTGSPREMRDIPKMPAVPSNFLQALDAIEQLIFPVTDVPPCVECIFVFGVSSDIAAVGQHVGSLCRQFNPKAVIISGGMPNYIDGTLLEKPEADLIAEHVELPNGTRLLLETEARHTLENVLLSKQKFDDVLQTDSVLLVCRSHHAGRAKLTFETHVEDPTVSVAPFVPTTGPYAGFTRDTWRSMLALYPRVWGEVLRIEQCSAKGNLRLPPQVQQLLRQIRDVIPG